MQYHATKNIDFLLWSVFFWTLGDALGPPGIRFHILYVSDCICTRKGMKELFLCVMFAPLFRRLKLTPKARFCSGCNTIRAFATKKRFSIHKVIRNVSIWKPCRFFFAKHLVKNNPIWSQNYFWFSLYHYYHWYGFCLPDLDYWFGQSNSCNAALVPRPAMPSWAWKWNSKHLKVEWFNLRG